jgi:hypothetical protein
MPRLAAWLTVFAIFFSVSIVRAPIPAVNEPHYLGKAKYVWNPDWCAGDFFLESSNPHLVFYVAFGWLTRFLTLPQTALVVRALGYLFLAWGWLRCATRLIPSLPLGVSTAAVFAGLMSLGNFSGEWLIGGAEAKVFAYGFLLWSADWLLKQQSPPTGWSSTLPESQRDCGPALWRLVLAVAPLMAAELAGACVSFHPVVGIWFVSVLVSVQLWGWWRPAGIVDLQFDESTRSSSSTNPLSPATGVANGEGQPSVGVGWGEGDVACAPAPLPPPPLSNSWEEYGRIVRQLDQWITPFLVKWRVALVAATVVLCSLPGLVPALSIVVGVDPEVSRQADQIVISERLGHHIDPLLFPMRAYLHYGILLGVAAALAAVVRVDQAGVAVGLVVGWLPEIADIDRFTPWRMTLLKFYPFRLADVALPWFIAIWSMMLLTGRLRRTAATRQFAVAVVIIAAGWSAALSLPAPDANASRMTPEVRDEWIATCHWLRDNTSPDALVATANEAWAVKWFSDRAEYVSFKDCPQDAAGILEWRRRWLYLESWSRAAKADGVISAADLARLHQETGIDYLIVSRYGPLETAPVHVQGPFKVYRVDD